MRKVIYLLPFSIFSFVVLFYLTNFVLVPKDENGELIQKNLFIVSAIYLIFASSLFAFFHGVFDKIFFKKFYQNPRITIGLRRGFILNLTLLSVVYLKLFGYWTWYNASLVVVMGILFELFFNNLLKKPKENLDQTEDKNNSDIKRNI